MDERMPHGFMSSFGCIKVAGIIWKYKAAPGGEDRPLVGRTKNDEGDVTYSLAVGGADGGPRGDGGTAQCVEINRIEFLRGIIPERTGRDATRRPPLFIPDGRRCRGDRISGRAAKTNILITGPRRCTGVVAGT